MKKKVVCLVMFFTLIFSSFSSSFSEAVNDVLEEDTEKTEEPPKKNESRSSSSDSDSDGSLLYLFVKLFGYLWLFTNTNIRYYDYPYQYGNNYLVNKNFEESFDEIGFYDDFYDESENLRPYRFSFDTSVFWMKDLGYGNDTRFEGQFYFIGPYFSNLFFSDDFSEFKSTYQGNVRLGGQFFLMQTNWLNASFVVQWSRWYGNDVAAEIKNGWTIGFDIRSYLVKPLGINWTTFWSSFGNPVGIYESNLNIGIFVNRFELYVAWRYMSVYNTDTDERADYWNGISLGTKVFF